MSEALIVFEQFNNLYNFIDKELQENNQFSIDVLLIDNNPSDVLKIISDYAPFSVDLLTCHEDLMNYFVAYLFKKKEYYNNLSLSDDKLGKLINKSGPGEGQHPKTDSLYYNEKEQEKYLDDILKRLIDCVNLYFSMYHDKSIPILLGDGTRLELKFLYSNLLHILGINKEQVKNNPELMRALNISENNIERLSSIEILERIIKDIQTNKDILCIQMRDNLEKYKNNETSGKIVSTQIDDATTTELLPYDKIDLKTRAFINSGPYSDVSVISSINPNTGFISSDRKKPFEEKEIKEVRISKTDFNSLKKDDVTLDDGKIKISDGDYVFNGYTYRPGDIRTLRSLQVGTNKNVIERDGKATNNISGFKKLFNGQSPIPVIGVEDPGGGTLRIFTPEQHQQMFFSLYSDFGGEGGMNFDQYIDILKDFAKSFENELMSQAIAKNSNQIIIPNNSNTRKR